MPYPYQLPTTTASPLSQSLTSSTHPSLPLTATSHRHGLRQALKTWKRTPPAQQSAQLPQLFSAIDTYLPYLFALDAGLSGKTVAGEEVDVVLVNEVVVEWRPVLSSTGLNVNVGISKAGSGGSNTTGRAGRARIKSLESEISFVLLTLSLTHALAARAELRGLAVNTREQPSSDDRSKIVAKAYRSMIDAHLVLNLLLSRLQQQQSPDSSLPDISATVVHGLAALHLAEATLITVLRDDPYPAIVAESRSQTSKEWMYKSPSIPKARAHVAVRLSLAAAEHAARAESMLAGSSSKGGSGFKLDESLLRYASDLRRTARGKAARFMGIEVEALGKAGEAIAWLQGARSEMGMAIAISASTVEGSGNNSSGFNKLRQQYRSKREEKKIIASQGSESSGSSTSWGSDGGLALEALVLTHLEAKWVKTNDTIGVQLIPEFGPLLASLPSGRDFPVDRTYAAPMLDESVVARMRAPPDESERRLVEGVDGADSDDGEAGVGGDDVPGAWPGRQKGYEGVGGEGYY